jgi:hypothetical protein
MRMIGHDHKRAQFRIRKMAGDFQPAILHDLSVFVQPNFPVNHIAEQAHPVVGADGDEVRAAP